MEFWLSGVHETPVGSASGIGFDSTANNEQHWGGVPVSRAWKIWGFRVHEEKGEMMQM
ncbi:hypothetical protein Hanom_Chr10g00874911 [Helianthus anomalus]